MFGIILKDYYESFCIKKKSDWLFIQYRLFDIPDYFCTKYVCPGFNDRHHSTDDLGLSSTVFTGTG